MIRLLDMMSKGDPALRKDKASHNSVAIFDGVGGTLFQKLKALAAPVLRTPDETIEIVQYGFVHLTGVMNEGGAECRLLME